MITFCAILPRIAPPIQRPKLKNSKVGHGDPNIDPHEVIFCMQVGIDVSDLQCVAEIRGTKIKILKVGDGDPDNDLIDLVSCMQLGIHLSDLQA